MVMDLNKIKLCDKKADAHDSPMWICRLCFSLLLSSCDFVIMSHVMLRLNIIIVDRDAFGIRDAFSVK